MDCCGQAGATLPSALRETCRRRTPLGGRLGSLGGTAALLVGLTPKGGPQNRKAPDPGK